MRRLRVLSGHPHLGSPNDVVREIENAQAYVDAGFAEWVDAPEEDEVETTDAPPPVVVDHTQVPETTTTIVGGEIETTTPRPAGTRGARAGSRRKVAE